MKPELKELLLASVLGFLAGPVCFLAGPSRFLAWYACVLACGALFTAGWLKELKPGKGAWLAFLLWPLVAGISAAVSLVAVTLLGR
ncbi:hypothetical protein [Desulfothermobacter acidiphilus]|uniref:hypothetical protein n=1 Tax=Desulfothermobacter acidiphilus TaxID=1938353 RepID=UPI003F8A0046